MESPTRSNWLTPFREAPIGTVCHVVASRLPKGLERSEFALAVGKRFSNWEESLASLKTQAETLGTTCHGQSSSRPVLLGRALAAGIRLLGPRADYTTEALVLEESQDLVEDDVELLVSSVPRPLEVHQHHMVNIRLSRFAALRVALACSRDACEALVQRLHSPEALAKLIISGTQLELIKRGGPILSGHAARWGPVAGNIVQKLLGDRFAAQTNAIFKRLARAFAGVDLHVRDDNCECAILQGESGPLLHVPLQCSGSPISAYVRPVEFQLVQRNGFIEFAEEPSSPSLRLGRSRSYSDSGVALTSSAIPFSLRFDCIDGFESSKPTDAAQNDSEYVVLPEVATSHLDDMIAKRASQQVQVLEQEEVALEDTIRTQSSPAPSMGTDFSCATQVPELQDRTIEEHEMFPIVEMIEVPPVQDPQVELRTTVQLRNLPKDFTRDSIVSLLIEKGFACQFCFVYLPMDFTLGGCLGYADICMESPTKALELQVCLQEHEIQSNTGTSVLETGWSERQGLTDMIARYRDSPVMHRSVCDSHRPALFEGGRRIKFPPPTRALRRPRIRGKQSAADHAHAQDQR